MNSSFGKAVPVPQVPRKLSATFKAQICNSMGASPALFHELPRLFKGIAALGSRAGCIARAVAQLRTGPSSLILDLACGKGAVSVQIAKLTQCQVLAVDASEAFLIEAQEHARTHHVSHLCRFQTADYRQIKPSDQHDVAMMIGLLPAPLAAPVVRLFVPAGGYYVVDDCIRLHQVLGNSHKGLPRSVVRNLRDQIEAAPTRNEIEHSMVSLEDQIVHYSPESARDAHRRLRKLDDQLAANIQAITQRDPQLKPLLRDYFEYQSQARFLLTGPLRSAFWIVKRGGDPSCSLAKGAKSVLAPRSPR